jgi:tetratricopeptide (TPR) repeat protein
MTRIILRGERVERASASSAASGFNVPGLQLLERVKNTGTSRGQGARIELQVSDEDVLKLQCEGGLIEVMTVAQARAIASTQRSVSGDAFELPTAFASGVGRGDAQRTVEEVQHFSVKQLHDRLRTGLVQQGAELGAEAIAALLEREFWNSRKTGLGLKRVDHGAEGFELLPDTQGLVSSEKPYLLLIHGTFSNASDGFQGFAGTKEWELLRQQYAGRILAFEHPTLGLSPLDNAYQLAQELNQALPDAARLHLITHSRGGLVGDLLNLPMPDAAMLKKLAEHRAAKRPAFKLSDLIRQSFSQFTTNEGEKLVELSKALGSKRVERYVRAAAPAAGTVLASRRLDKILKLVLNVVGLTPGLAGNPIYGFVEALTLATVGIKSEPRVLPGLEAMMPDSPFVWFLNQLNVRNEDQLAIIAGDIEGNGVFGRLKVFASDLLYGFVDHDLVVNTEAMYQGLKRAQSFASFQQGPLIAHTHYFGNDLTRARINNYLLRDPDDSSTPRGFKAISTGTRQIAADNTTRGAGAAPSRSVVLVGAQFTSLVPLKTSNGSPKRMQALDRLVATGGVAQLEETADSVALGDFYDSLRAKLEVSARVVELAYDLRLGPKELGAKLEQKIAEALKLPGPVSIVAHSGGALAVVAWLATRKDKEKQDIATRLRGGRIVLLGPPLTGSFEALRWVLGDGALVQSLALLDVGRGSQDIAKVLRSLNGVLALLPPQSALARVEDLSIAGAPPEIAKALSSAAELRKVIDKALGEQLLRGVHCVFGQASQTSALPALAAELADNRDGVSAEAEEPAIPARAWNTSSAGDGFMLRPGADQLGGASAWLATTDHVGLACDESLLLALLELLDVGQTRRLRTLPSQPAQPQLQRLVPQPQLFPSADSLARAGLGVPTRRRTERDEATGLELVVVNGSLDCCKGAIAIGHYTGAPIAGAGDLLDRRLGGALRNHQYLGLYPEVAGQSQLIGRGRTARFFALVLGLGSNGELTPELLTTAIANGALRCALAEAEDEIAAPFVNVELNSLLIGTIGRQGLSIPSAVTALVRGVLRANRALQEREGSVSTPSGELPQRVRITKLTLVERYQDLAEEAVRAVAEVEKLLSAELVAGMRLEPQRYVQERAEGWRPGRPERDYEHGSWQPLLIERAKDSAMAGPNAVKDPTLTFTYLGRFARAEGSDGVVAAKQVEELIEETVSRHDFGQVNNTIYELLIPQQLKDDIASASNLQLVVDPDTASIPWELMATRDPVKDEPQPLSTKIGILRRLKLDGRWGIRENVRTPMGLHALVVGDPWAGPDYPPLPGAREEAKAVEQLLIGARYAVRSMIGRSSPRGWSDILNAAFERGYRIMHIAAHGVYRPEAPLQSGVVIGPDRFLNPSTINQLPIVPELVFLNCCHLGRTGQGLVSADGASPPELMQRHLNAFAASVATRLMQIGVRAVVAAGWAVDDRAASSFATTFYGSMLRGVDFGESVKQARQAARDVAPDSNTWGAYQCYGDPAFRLSRDGAQDDQPRPVVGVGGFKNRLENLMEDAADAGSAGEVANLFKQLAQLEREAPPHWLEYAETRSLLGCAYSQFGDYATAIRHYRVALACNSADWPGKLVEQLANLEVRRAAQIVHGAEPAEGEDDPDELFKLAYKRLTIITELQATPERLALLGSYHKKRATTLTDPKAITGALEAAVESYFKAWKLKGDPNGVYQLSNYLQLCALLARATDEQQGLLDNCEQRAAERARRNESFWDRVGPADVELTQLLCKTSGVPVSAYEPVAQMYENAFKSARARELERNSVSEHLCDLEILCDVCKRDNAREGLRSVLNKLNLACYPRRAAPDDKTPSVPPASPKS